MLSQLCLIVILWMNIHLITLLNILLLQEKEFLTLKSQRKSCKKLTIVWYIQTKFPILKK